MAQVYINLPVADLPKATAFYEALGFVKNPQFSNEQASGLAFDTNVIVMLLSHDFTKTFLPEGKEIADAHKTCEVFNAIQLGSREEVDAMFNKAIAAWWREAKAAYDHGFMYGHDFEDLDGHIWEPFRMDASQMQQQA